MNRLAAIRFACLPMVCLAAPVALAGGWMYGGNTWERSRSSLVVTPNPVVLGEIPRGKAQAVSVWAMNLGREVLRVDPNKIRSTCACVRARLAKTELPPGQRVDLGVLVGSTASLGPFRYSVHLPVEGSKGGEMLAVEGTTVGPGAAYPPRLFFGSMNHAESTRKGLYFLFRNPGDHVESVASDLEFVHCAVEWQKQGGAKMSVCLDGAPVSGPVKGRVLIHTSDPERREVIVPIETAVGQPGR